jgi:3-methyladenine DNA glycosylase AlkC
MRKGYNRLDAIPKTVLRALNTGQEEPRTLAEWLAIDVVQLLGSVLPGVGLGDHTDVVLQVARNQDRKGPMERHRAIGDILFQVTRHSPETSRVFEALATHPSGMVREWAALMVAADPHLAIEERIARARTFAVDPSMSVREIAWMSYRPYLAQNLAPALRVLADWVLDPDPNVRRCAIESTRPRGVWCAHLAALKEDPDRGLPLLEAVRADKSRYVQFSAANWLNDVSKTNARWVLSVCGRWQRQSPVKETEWIVHHALRGIRKADGADRGP